MAAIPKAAAQLRADALPVLFADTCTLVDVIRAPIRPKELRGCVKGAIDLRSALVNQPKRCSLVVASFVPTEWQTHAEQTGAELRKHLESQDRFATSFHDSCSSLGINVTFDRASYGNVDLAAQLLALSQDILNLAVHLDPSDQAQIRACGRAARCIPPSKQGGEIKDCIIVEECLEVCLSLRNAGFQQKLIFCTSNSDDYQEGPNLHPVLANDFAAVGLSFANSIPWAIHDLLR